ncbi:MAG TPA: nuclear transport factor 2 family protein [Jiangellales bacterium]|nr:nuclear transport factor 2 family protein [Jiangellales bacterium]
MSGEQAAVLAVNQAFYDAVEQGDLDALEAVWVDDERGAPVCVHPGLAPIHGRAGVLRSWAAVMAGTPYLQFVLTDVDVQVHGATAVVSCTENMLSAAEGMPTSSFAGGHAVATNVFRATPAGWRLWVHHASPVLSPQGD